MTADEPQLTKVSERIPGLRAASLRRLAAYSLPVLAVLALAAALLWLLPVDPAQAQDDAAGLKITAGPTIASSPASGDTYRAGETITVTLTFGEPVTVTGKPRLRLKIGDQKRWAGYDSTGADGATLFFTHAVKADDADADGVSIGKNQLKLNGGTIADADGNAANLKHPKLADQAGHKVKGAPDEPPPPTNNEPQFAAATAARSVAENSAAGENVGGPVTATDDDNDTLTYALTGADAGSFGFDASTGQLTVRDALDYEAKASYAVTIAVHDGKDTAGEADASEDASIAVTISVLNVDEPGTVILDTDAPQSGSAVNAIVFDPDGGVTGETWTWERSADGIQWTAIAGATAATYTPNNDDAGQYLRATASYADGEGTGKSARAATTGTVAAAAVVEPSPSVSAGPAIASAPASGDTYRAGETITVTLTFGEPVTVTGKPRLRLKIGDQKRWAGYESAVGATLNFVHAVKPDDVDSDGVSIGKNQLKLNGGTIVDADGNAANLKHPKLADQAGHKVNGAPDEPEPPPTPEPQPQRAANNEPQFADATTNRSVNENTAAGTNVGTAVTATDYDSDTLTYALTGADAGSFDLDAASGQISVKDALDYETKPSYTVAVTAHDGKNVAGDADASVDDTIAVTINVLNVDEAGVVSLLTENDAFEVDREISAVLLDPDGGVTSETWTWERSADSSQWTAIAGATGAAYTPSADDEGQYLRATASYADAEGPGKTARAATAVAAARPVTLLPQMVDRPARQTGLTATPGNGQVTLAWTDPSDTTAGNTYQYRRRTGGAGNWSRWTTGTATGATAGTNGAVSYTVTNLSNGTEYQFEVRARAGLQAARNWSTAATATPLSTITTPTTPVATTAPSAPTGLRALGNDKFVGLYWNNPGDGSITKYQYQQKAGAGMYGSWTDMTGSSATATNYSVSSLMNGTAYKFKIRAVNSVGNSLESEEAGATPTATPDAIADYLCVKPTGVMTPLPTVDQAKAVPAGIARDCNILLAVRDTLVGASGTALDWAYNKKVSEWDGVRANRPGIYSLRLSGHGLKGTIPPALGELNLLWLSLGRNELTGTIPPPGKGARALTELSLGGNQLTGAIPALGGYVNLQELDLASNQLTGAIPAELGNLSKLETLDLYHNRLTGAIPADLKKLTSLRILDLNTNAEVNYIVDAAGGFTGSTRTVRYRQEVVKRGLSGPIPDLSGLKKLERLHLGGNSLTGSIPAWLASLPALQQIELSNNHLSGSIPEQLGCAGTGLEILDLNFNDLRGEVPAKLGLLTGLRHLHLLGQRIYRHSDGSLHHGNQYSGTLPSSIQDLDITGPTPERLQETIGLEWSGDAATGDCASLQLEVVQTREPVITGEPRVYLTLSRPVLTEQTTMGYGPDQDRPGDTNFSYVRAELDQAAEHDLVVTLDEPAAGAGYKLGFNKLVIFAGNKYSQGVAGCGDSAGNPNADPPCRFPSVYVKAIDDEYGDAVYNPRGIIEITGTVAAYKADQVGKVTSSKVQSWNGRMLNNAKFKNLKVVCQPGGSNLCDGGGSGNTERPTLHGPEPGSFIIKEDEQIPEVFFTLEPVVEGRRRTLVAYISPVSAAEVTVTLDTPGNASLSGTTLTIPAGRAGSSNSITIETWDNSSTAHRGTTPIHRVVDHTVPLSGTASSDGSVVRRVRGSLTVYDNDQPPLLIAVGAGRIDWLPGTNSNAHPQSFSQYMTLSSNASSVLATPRVSLMPRPVDVRVRVKKIAVGDRFGEYNFSIFPDDGVWVTSHADEDLSRMIGEATRKWGSLTVRDRHKVVNQQRVSVNPNRDDDDDWDDAVVYMYVDSAPNSIQCRTPGTNNWRNLSGDGTCPGVNIKFKPANSHWATVTMVDPKNGDAPTATNPNKVARLSFTQDPIKERDLGSAQIKIALDDGQTAGSDTTFKVYVPRPFFESSNYELIDPTNLADTVRCSNEGPFCVLTLPLGAGENSVTTGFTIKAKHTDAYDDPYELTVIAEKTGGDSSVGFYRKWTEQKAYDLRQKKVVRAGTTYEGTNRATLTIKE